jgi:putative ABC transport system permease protein
LGLQPLAKIRLYPALDGAIQPPGDARYLYIFGAIGLVILIIACINYMNLATATSMQRAREVGMRKALGAQRYQLAGQFLAESIFFTGISFLVALALAQLLLPVFGTLTGKSLSFFDLQSWPFTRYSLLFILITGCLSGGYPVLVLSSFLPQRVLKGSGSLNNKSKLRQGLVIFQFVIATVLMIGTLVIRHQLTYIRHKRLGYDAEHVVSLPMTKSLGDRLSAGVLKPDPKRITTVRQTLSGLPGVQDVSVAFSTPNGYLTSEVKYQGQSYQVTNLPVDYNYAKTMKFQFLAGRNFSKKHATDSSKAVIVNETAAKLFNLKDKVGQSIDLNLGHTHPTLIGIVKDFHTASLHHHIRPTILTIEPAYYDAYVVRLAAGSLPGVLGLMKRAWKKLAPQYPFTYHFLEDQLEAQYQPERRAGQIFASFSTLAIIIACLGLFGLAAYTAELRIREIGIRKVMGATVANIIGLLSKDFLTLVLLGFVIAIPIAWYAMHRWLTNFAYHIDIGVGIFAVAGTIALLIAVATVSWQSIRAALANPVDSLRNE